MKNNKFLPFKVLAIFIAGLLFGRYVFGLKENSYTLSFLSGTVSKMQSVVNVIADKYVDQTDIEAITEKAIPLLLKQLDPHSIYIPAANTETSMEKLNGSFCGIGIEYYKNKESIEILNVIQNGPAMKAGIIAGDEITEINGKKVSGLNIGEELRGEKGSSVNITLNRSGKIVKAVVSREDIPLTSVEGVFMIDTLKVGYIRINGFAQNTYTEFREAAEMLMSKGMKYLIIDLRGNGGGYIKSVTEIADEILDKNDLIVYTKGRNGAVTEYRAQGNGLCSKIKIFALIDTYTASAAEILSGAIQDNDRGMLVGRRTFGKGLVQEPISFADGSMLRLTIARYYTPSGRCIQKPYGDNINYAEEIQDRYKRGELDSINSSIFDESNQYYTKKGRIIYGGGGIAPDYFVAEDTVYKNPVYQSLEKSNIISRCAAHAYNTMKSAKGNPSDEEIFQRIIREENKTLWFVFNEKDNDIKPDEFKPYAETFGNFTVAQIESHFLRIAGAINSCYMMSNLYDKDFCTALQYIIKDENADDNLNVESIRKIIKADIIKKETNK